MSETYFNEGLPSAGREGPNAGAGVGVSLSRYYTTQNGCAFSVRLVELTDECIDRIADAVVRKIHGIEANDLQHVLQSVVFDNLYPCDPEKAKQCPKTACFINGGPCRMTTHSSQTIWNEEDVLRADRLGLVLSDACEKEMARQKAAMEEDYGQL